MKDWKDYKYIVTGRRMTDDNNEIESLRVETYNSKNNELNFYQLLSKIKFASMLPNNSTAVTAPPTTTGKVEMGAEICVIKAKNGTVYLRTKPDGIEKDNLDHLPIF